MEMAFGFYPEISESALPGTRRAASELWEHRSSLIILTGSKGKAISHSRCPPLFAAGSYEEPPLHLMPWVERERSRGDGGE